MLKDVTINVQLQQLIKRMCIPHFRGIFMRTTLRSRGSILKREQYRKFG